MTFKLTCVSCSNAIVFGVFSSRPFFSCNLPACLSACMHACNAYLFRSCGKAICPYNDCLGTATNSYDNDIVKCKYMLTNPTVWCVVVVVVGGVDWQSKSASFWRIDSNIPNARIEQANKNGMKYRSKIKKWKQTNSAHTRNITTILNGNVFILCIYALLAYSCVCACACAPWERQNIDSWWRINYREKYEREYPPYKISIDRPIDQSI